MRAHGRVERRIALGLGLAHFAGIEQRFRRDNRARVLRLLVIVVDDVFVAKLRWRSRLVADQHDLVLDARRRRKVRRKRIGRRLDAGADQQAAVDGAVGGERGQVPFGRDQRVADFDAGQRSRASDDLAVDDEIERVGRKPTLAIVAQADVADKEAGRRAARPRVLNIEGIGLAFAAAEELEVHCPGADDTVGPLYSSRRIQVLLITIILRVFGELVEDVAAGDVDILCGDPQLAAQRALGTLYIEQPGCCVQFEMLGLER